MSSRQFESEIMLKAIQPVESMKNTFIWSKDKVSRLVPLYLWCYEAFNSVRMWKLYALSLSTFQALPWTARERLFIKRCVSALPSTQGKQNTFGLNKGLNALWRNQFGDTTFHKLSAAHRIFKLITNRNSLTGTDETRQVRVQCVVRKPSHSSTSTATDSKRDGENVSGQYFYYFTHLNDCPSHLRVNSVISAESYS